MPNAIYPKWKEALLNGSPDSALTGGGTTGLYAMLVANSYTFSPFDQFYSDVAASLAIVGTPQEITGVTKFLGVVDGNDVIFPLIGGGATLNALVLFRRNTGVNSTWRLVAYLQDGYAPLPMTPNGQDIRFYWNSAGIFSI